MLRAGYRHVDLWAVSSPTIELGAGRTKTFNTFLQDEIVVRNDLSLTLGSKLEHDTLGGWGLLPSARLMCVVSPNQRAWPAVSRTRRTPSFTDPDARATFRLI